MKLFDKKNRICLDPALRNENTYNYLNNSNRSKINDIRDKLEDWFKEYSVEVKREIKQRIKTNEHFDSVLFEMYLYELFLKMNFEIESHPEMEFSKNKPDFLLTKNNNKVYVEAKIDYSLSDKLQKERKSENHLLDDINNIKDSKYRITLLEKEILSKDQPSMKGFKKHLKKQFSELNYAKTKELTQKGIQFLKFYEYDDEDLYVKYKIFGVEEGYNDHRLIQIGDGSPVEWTDSQSSLKNSLNKKSKRYGEMKAPFIIVINSLDPFIDENDIRSVLLGSFQNEIIINKNNNKIVSLYKYHEDNGFFSSNKTKRNNNVTAVLIYNNVSLGNNENPEYWFIENPNARYTLDLHQINLNILSQTQINTKR